MCLISKLCSSKELVPSADLKQVNVILRNFALDKLANVLLTLTRKMELSVQIIRDTVSMELVQRLIPNVKASGTITVRVKLSFSFLIMSNVAFSWLPDNSTRLQVARRLTLS